MSRDEVLGLIVRNLMNPYRPEQCAEMILSDLEDKLDIVYPDHDDYCDCGNPRLK